MGISYNILVKLRHVLLTSSPQKSAVTASLQHPEGSICASTIPNFIFKHLWNNTSTCEYNNTYSWTNLRVSKTYTTKKKMGICTWRSERGCMVYLRLALFPKHSSRNNYPNLGTMKSSSPQDSFAKPFVPSRSHS